jgi:hypothetical protein
VIRGRVWLAIALLAAGAIALHRSWVPPAWDPTVPLDLQAPRTPVTRLKLALLHRDPTLCRAALATASAPIVPAPGLARGACPVTDAVRVSGGPITTAPSSFLASCPLAVSWVMFETDVARPLARAHFGSDLVRIDHLGTYACRDVRNEPGRLSAHARADAIDVSAFVLSTGRTIPVSHWRGHDADAAFLHDLRDRACSLFGIVLSPDYDSLHASHLHLQAGGFGLCR